MGGEPFVLAAHAAARRAGWIDGPPSLCQYEAAAAAVGAKRPREEAQDEALGEALGEALDEALDAPQVGEAPTIDLT